jgi:hypothetical protein
MAQKHPSQSSSWAATMELQIGLSSNDDSAIIGVVKGDSSGRSAAR